MKIKAGQIHGARNRRRASLPRATSARSWNQTCSPEEQSAIGLKANDRRFWPDIPRDSSAGCGVIEQDIFAVIGQAIVLASGDSDFKGLKRPGGGAGHWTGRRQESWPEVTNEFAIGQRPYYTV